MEQRRISPAIVGAVLLVAGIVTPLLSALFSGYVMPIAALLAALLFLAGLTTLVVCGIVALIAAGVRAGNR